MNEENHYEPKIIVINESSEAQFAAILNDYLANGYEILSSSVGFANSEQYDFCGVYQALLQKKEDITITIFLG